ncbi:hypothetical protein KEH51_28185 [[Brevibacterium] frigoritolerans]|uniref:Uncharacterized protein n=1 Tax=Peribacillus frigoritolerans TaxID=450367 RepID=A0A941FLC3_9BACI|nr:hypothetical protein [Peribacillus frigoritolerans]
MDKVEQLKRWANEVKENNFEHVFFLHRISSGKRRAGIRK